MSAFAALATGSLTVRRPPTLRQVGTAGHATALLLDGAALTGATSISVKLASGAKLQGSLPQGAVLTISGTDYAVAAEAIAATGATSLAVTIAPGLAGDLADETAVAVGADPAEWTLDNVGARSVRFEERAMLTAQGIEVAGACTVLPTSRPPREGDSVRYTGADNTKWEGVVHSVAHVHAFNIDRVVARA